VFIKAMGVLYPLGCVDENLGHKKAPSSGLQS